jgi:hypothetical protein
MTGTKTDKETKPSTVVANDPDDLKGVLKNIGGSRSDHWNNTLANQAVQALWLKHSDPATRDKHTAPRLQHWSASVRRTSWRA